MVKIGEYGYPEDDTRHYVVESDESVKFEVAYDYDIGQCLSLEITIGGSKICDESMTNVNLLDLYKLLSHVIKEHGLEYAQNEQ